MSTLQHWINAGEKMAAVRFETDYLNWASVSFSGHVAGGELCDGPFCELSMVDNRAFKRLFYQVLDHDATPEDVLVFLQHCRATLDARSMAVRAITIDESGLYPAAIVTVFGSIPHQACQFHMLRQITTAVWHAVASVRKQLAAQKPKQPRGRPPKRPHTLARQRARLEAKFRDRYTHRYLFVQRHLTPAERKTLHFITRSLSQLHTLREIIDEVCRLFDRRCWTETALAKLARLRARVQRFTCLGQLLQRLFCAQVEKALTFLDDGRLPAITNAVERANRRHRKTLFDNDQARVPGFSPALTDFATASTVNSGHGRLETRILTSSGLLAKACPWPGAQQVFKLKRKTEVVARGQQQAEVVHGITSLSVAEAGPARLLAIVREYWGQDNGLHYRRDVTFCEDAGRTCDWTVAEAIAILNNLAWPCCCVGATPLSPNGAAATPPTPPTPMRPHSAFWPPQPAFGQALAGDGRVLTMECSHPIMCRSGH